MMAMMAGTLTAQITDPTYWDRVQLYANWKFDYDTVRINRLHIENQTGFDSTGNLFMYRGTTPANGKLLIGNGSGFVMANLASSDGTITITNGAGTIDLASNVTPGDLSGFTETYVPYGASDGSLDESVNFTYGSTVAGLGLGISLDNTAVDPASWTTLGLTSTNGWAYMTMGSDEASYLYFRDAAETTSYWIVGHDRSGGIFKIDNNTEDEDLQLGAFNFSITEDEGGQNTTYTGNGWTMGGRVDITHAAADANTGLTVDLSNASATGKVVEFQHQGTTKFQVSYTGSTVINKTTNDATHALNVGNNGASATGNILQLSNTSGEQTSFNISGKIGKYAGTTPASGSILQGDGTDMEFLTLGTAGQALIVNAGATAATWGVPTQRMPLGGVQDLTIGASTTTYISYNQVSNAVEARRNYIMPMAGTIREMYVVMSGTQDASGSLVITMRKNGSSQTLAVTVAAGSGTGTYSDTSNSFSVSAGDLVSIQVTNNATATSARIVSVVTVFEHQ